MPVKPPIDAEDALTKRRCKKWDERVYHVYFVISDSDTDADFDKPPTVNSTQAPRRKPKKKKKKSSINWQLVKENEKLMKKEFSILDEMIIFNFVKHEEKQRLLCFKEYLEETFFISQGKFYELLDEIEKIESLFEDEFTVAETGKEFCDKNID